METQLLLNVQDYLLSPSPAKQEGENQLQNLKYYLFCDPIPSSSRKKYSETDAFNPVRIVSDAVREKLDPLPPKELDEFALQEALEYANVRLLQAAQEAKQSSKVNALIIVPPTSGSSELCITGVGDCRVYEVLGDKTSLVFFNPKSIQSSTSDNIEERSKTLKNVLGYSLKLHVHTKTLPGNHLQKLLAASWGVYSQLSQWELLKIGLKPEFITSQAAGKMTSKLAYAHGVQFSVLQLIDKNAAANNSSRKKLSLFGLLKKLPNKALISFSCFIGLIILGGTFQLLFGQDGPLAKRSQAKMKTVSEEYSIQASHLESLKKEIDEHKVILENLKAEQAKLIKDVKSVKPVHVNSRLMQHTTVPTHSLSPSTDHLKPRTLHQKTVKQFALKKNSSH